MSKKLILGYNINYVCNTEGCSELATHGIVYQGGAVGTRCSNCTKAWKAGAFASGASTEDIRARAFDLETLLGLIQFLGDNWPHKHPINSIQTTRGTKYSNE